MTNSEWPIAVSPATDNIADTNILNRVDIKNYKYKQNNLF